MRCLGHLHRDLCRKVVLIGNAAGLQKAVGAILLGTRVGAIRFGHVEIGLRAIAREPEVGVVQHREQLTAGHTVAFAPEHPFEARGNLRHDGDLRTRIERASQRHCLGQVACLHGCGAYRKAALRFDRGRCGFCLGPAARGSSRRSEHEE